VKFHPLRKSKSKDKNLKRKKSVKKMKTFTIKERSEKIKEYPKSGVRVYKFPSSILK